MGIESFGTYLENTETQKYQNTNKPQIDYAKISEQIRLIREEEARDNENDNIDDLLNFDENIEAGETNNLDREIIIQKAKTILYENLGVNENLESNSLAKRFLKGLVDGLVIENGELMIEVYNTNGEIILESLKQLASLEGIRQLLQSLGETIWNLYDGNAYEKGKSVSEIGGNIVGILKKGIKVGIKKSINEIVESQAVKDTANSVSKEVADKLKGIDYIKSKKFIDNIINKKEHRTPENIKHGLEILMKAGIPKEYLNLLKGAGMDNLQVLKRYKFILNNGEVNQKFLDLINKAKENRGLTLLEAHTIFGYTNEAFYIQAGANNFCKLNFFARNKLGKMLNRPLDVEEKKGLKKLRKIFDEGLDKMPNAEEKILFRGDDNIFWRSRKPIKLKGYTSVANNIDDTFIDRKDTLIALEIMPGRAKDISELAFYKHFADEIKESERKTNHEGILLRGGKVVIQKSDKNIEISIKDKENEGQRKNKIVKKITARQIK